MHDTAYEIGQKFLEFYWADGFGKILDVGSGDVNGTLRDFCPPDAEYVGVDLEPGAGVDVVLDDPHSFPFDDESFDIVLSSSCFEHDQMFWLTFAEMGRVLRPGGYIYISAPSNGVYHSYPHDNWRFYPDSGLALEAWAKKLGLPLDLVESFTARRKGDIWNDFVMVFAKGGDRTVEPEKHLSEQFPDAFNIRRRQEPIANFCDTPEDMQLLNEINETTRALQTERDSEINNLNQAVAERARKASRLQIELEHIQNQLHEERLAREAVYRSTSWRITAPLRALKRAVTKPSNGKQEDESSHACETGAPVGMHLDSSAGTADELNPPIDDRESASAVKPTVLDVYVTDPPAPENPFHIFDGEWSSDIPGFGLGRVKTFDDHRIKWIGERCGGFAGKRILELGPLEGGHTYMMATAGAAHITSIESNTRAFLKCLVVKNALNFEADFRLGDFRPFLATCRETYDIALASGVLYHMTDPVQLLTDLARVAPALGIWTHYYDEEVISARPDLKEKFSDVPRVQNVGSRKVVMYQQHYLKALDWAGFCGGSAPESYWLTKDSLLGVLEDLGLSVEIDLDEKSHPNGPCMLLFAKRAGGGSKVLSAKPSLTLEEGREDAMRDVQATNENFNEQAYLRANPDVAAAVEKGAELSGRAHFEKHGHKERRLLKFISPPPAPASPEPHYVTEYRKLVSQLTASYALDEAMSLAVGGDYENIGNKQADLLHEWGLKDGHFVIDIGCGSGRLASAMQKRSTEIQYLGTDVVPELLEYAKTKAPPHYRFQLSTELSIPASDASVDFVTFFSVFTHLYHEESFTYLKDGLRVLRKGGAVIFTFLEAGQHWTVFTAMTQRRLEQSTIELTMFIERPMIDVWASKLGFHIEQDKAGLPRGQSVVLLRKL